MNETVEKDYLVDLQKIKETIKQGQYKAMVKVNSEMIMTYYKIGEIINKRKEWGNKYIERLSSDLIEYGKGYSIRNLERMSRSAREFSHNEITAQLGAQIPWRTIIEIMQKSSTHEEMIFYINETYKNGWSRSMLINQFKMKTYERSLIEPMVTPAINLPDYDLVNGLFKDTYIFDFIDKNNIMKEKDLEQSLIENISRFILELGEGFAFVGNQYHLEVSNKDYYIDLLFYNLKVRSYVVIELKVGEFKPDYIGQLMFYVNSINHTLKMENDNPTIGLLLCSEADRIVSMNTLEGTTLPLGISKYKFIEELPAYIERRLKEKNEKQ